ncbi:MAG: phosphopyruvate hydratase [Patescibacteria group bacterium]|nr:phosphopyruvate hydratase [Patescibacteria group bacterium]
MRIDRIEARATTDTRGKPTVEATLRAGGVEATASVPSGKSTGKHEAKELRDSDGGVQTAVGNVAGEIAKLMTSREWHSPDELDEALIALDGTPDKSRLGANAILAVSIGAQRLFAEEAGVPLWKAIAERGGFTPRPPSLYVNVMNGGAHANFRLPIQEYILVAEGKTSVAFAAAEAVFKELGAELGDVPMGDEGGYSPTFPELDKPFEILAALVAKHPGTSIAIDAAANELLNDHGGYTLIGKDYTPSELTMIYHSAVQRFPLRSIEDPFAEDDMEHFTKLTMAIGQSVIIIGDDLTVTNPARINAAHAAHAINGVLIKPNQIGTVKEAISAVQTTHQNGWKAVCSHRSGETMDTFIADFAYGVGAHGLKAGAFGQKERLAKYERLLEIEREAEAV